MHGPDDVPLIARVTSLPFATSRHVFPSASRRVSSMPSCSSKRLTTSRRGSDAAKCRAVVPEPGGWTALGEMDRWPSSSATVSPGIWSG